MMSPTREAIVSASRRERFGVSDRAGAVEAIAAQLEELDAEIASRFRHVLSAAERTELVNILGSYGLVFEVIAARQREHDIRTNEAISAPLEVWELVEWTRHVAQALCARLGGFEQRSSARSRGVDKP